MSSTGKTSLAKQPAPVSVILMTLNEAHQLPELFKNIEDFASKVYVVDSYSADQTVSIALAHGATVVQRRFRNFGDQWNFALQKLPIETPWTMKLDPDERLTEQLKMSLREWMSKPYSQVNAIRVRRRMWFMKRPLSAVLDEVRLWRTGRCRFTPVLVNEHPIVDGPIAMAQGELEHHDSPDLEHWLNKQNKYSTAEAISAFQGSALADEPWLFGTSLQRRMWLKRNFYRLPFRYMLLFLHCLLVRGAWRAGRVGWIWSHLRCEVMRMREFKLFEMRQIGRVPEPRVHGHGAPDPRVPHCDESID
jgi:hypothetical protein